MFAPDGQIAFVTGRGAAELLLVDMREGRRRTNKKSLPGGNQPNGLAMKADGTYLYVGNDRDNTISVIDVRLLETVNVVPTGKYPDGIAFRK
jgi:YVTN family beta-propeller protein